MCVHLDYGDVGHVMGSSHKYKAFLCIYYMYTARNYCEPPWHTLQGQVPRKILEGCAKW